MAHKVASITLRVICLAAFCMTLVSAVQASDGCSTANAAGNWGLKATNWQVIPPSTLIPVASVSRISADTAGNITGTFFGNEGGEFATYTVTGTWTVNADCTGSVSVRFYSSGTLVQTAQFVGVFVQNSQEFFSVEQSAQQQPGNAPLFFVSMVEGKRLTVSTSNQQ